MKSDTISRMWIAALAGLFIVMSATLPLRAVPIAALAFSPDGRFFYFSSQRGPGPGAQTGMAGITYCIEGPWFTA